jgi:hypothetical protein
MDLFESCDGARTCERQIDKYTLRLQLECVYYSDIILSDNCR